MSDYPAGTVAMVTYGNKQFRAFKFNAYRWAVQREGQSEAQCVTDVFSDIQPLVVFRGTRKDLQAAEALLRRVNGGFGYTPAVSGEQSLAMRLRDALRELPELEPPKRWTVAELCRDVYPLFDNGVGSGLYAATREVGQAIADALNAAEVEA